MWGYFLSIESQKWNYSAVYNKYFLGLRIKVTNSVLEEWGSYSDYAS